VSELVSILIPAFNAENWIRDTMASAVEQTWRHKEVIVVDDGSSDRTLEIANSFASRTVKVVTQPNSGACGARNKALSLAQGSYIQWLDADDLLHREKIARQMARRCDEGESRVLLTSAWGKFFFSPKRAKFSPDPLWQDLTPIDWIMAKLQRNAWMNPTVWLVSRRLTELAGPWDVRLTSSGDDDGEYICRVVAATEGVKFVPEARCYYRIGNVGSLNWNMEKTEEGLDSLLLSLTMTIGHLLSLENSNRTHAAAVKYLETFAPYFYASRTELTDRLQAVAREFGGAIDPSKVGWKYRPLEKILGPKKTKVVMNNWRSTKLRAQRAWDGCLCQMGS
jgi:glycosyltransferase involved in cell wall biosynthesis